MELSKRKKGHQRNKNMMRTLTNKERFLTTLLVIIIIFWTSFKYIINPQMIKISTLESQINDYTMQIKNNNKMIKYEYLITEKKNNLVFEKERIEKDFFKSLSQPEIIYTLNKLLLKNDIEIENITFNKPFVEILNGKEIQKIEISIPFKGDFESLIEVIKKIEEGSRKIVISDIDIEKSKDIEIEGNINLGVYSLTEIVQVEEKDINIKSIEDNRLNPFTPYNGYVDPIEENIKEYEKENSGDNVPIDKEEYEIHKTIKGDNISYISMKQYGTEEYVDEILKINNMIRSSVLPIGKEVKLMKK